MINWLNHYWQVNTLAAIVQLMAIPSYLLCFWTKKKAFLILNIITSVFYSLGYICMGAWSGVILAVMTAVICLIVFFLDKSEISGTTSKRRTRWVLLVGFGFVNVIISAIFETNPFAAIMVLASLLNYHNYFLMRENDIKTKIIFIISHIFIIIYEIVVKLYFFASMDFLATLSLIGALIGALSLKKHNKKNKLQLSFDQSSQEEDYGK